MHMTKLLIRCKLLITSCFSLQSVVKSHLDAIPEDRKAIEKGGGNAVQKLHEVEKYIRKNKLKVGLSSNALDMCSMLP